MVKVKQVKNVLFEVNKIVDELKTQLYYMQKINEMESSAIQQYRITYNPETIMLRHELAYMLRIQKTLEDCLVEKI
jgi:hypothetical protein